MAINKDGWELIDGLAGAFALTVGKTVEFRTDKMADCPANCGWAGATEFEAIRLGDGSWFAIEYDPGSPGYSTWTPTEPGYCYIWIRPA